MIIILTERANLFKESPRIIIQNGHVRIEIVLPAKSKESNVYRFAKELIEKARQLGILTNTTLNNIQQSDKSGSDGEGHEREDAEEKEAKDKTQNKERHVRETPAGSLMVREMNQAKVITDEERKLGYRVVGKSIECLYCPCTLKDKKYMRLHTKKEHPSKYVKQPPGRKRMAAAEQDEGIWICSVEGRQFKEFWRYHEHVKRTNGHERELTRVEAWYRMGVKRPKGNADLVKEEFAEQKLDQIDDLIERGKASGDVKMLLEHGGQGGGVVRSEGMTVTNPPVDEQNEDMLEQIRKDYGLSLWSKNGVAWRYKWSKSVMDELIEYAMRRGTIVQESGGEYRFA